jgi:flagellar basal body rod protein FlgB
MWGLYEECPMPEPISDAAITAALGRQLNRAVQKQAAAVGNLANLDTPGYRRAR